MTSRVLFVDTSILLNLLRVPDHCDDHAAVLSEFKTWARQDVLFVIPLTSVIETGNAVGHIADGNERRRCALQLCGILGNAIKDEQPWALSRAEWDEQTLQQLVDGHLLVLGLVQLAQDKVGAGDAAILHEVQRFRTRVDVPSQIPLEIWTKDGALGRAAAAIT